MNDVMKLILELEYIELYLSLQHIDLAVLMSRPTLSSYVQKHHYPEITTIF